MNWYSFVLTTRTCCEVERTRHCAAVTFAALHNYLLALQYRHAAFFCLLFSFFFFFKSLSFLLLHPTVFGLRPSSKIAALFRGFDTGARIVTVLFNNGVARFKKMLGLRVIPKPKAIMRSFSDMRRSDGQFGSDVLDIAEGTAATNNLLEGVRKTIFSFDFHTVKTKDIMNSLFYSFVISPLSSMWHLVRAIATDSLRGHGNAASKQYNSIDQDISQLEAPECEVSIDSKIATVSRMRVSYRCFAPLS